MAVEGNSNTISAVSKVVTDVVIIDSNLHLYGKGESRTELHRKGTENDSEYY